MLNGRKSIDISREITKLKPGGIYRCSNITIDDSSYYVSYIFQYNRILRRGGSEKFLEYNWLIYKWSRYYDGHPISKPYSYITKQIYFLYDEFKQGIRLGYKITPLTPSRAKIVLGVINKKKLDLL